MEQLMPLSAAVVGGAIATFTLGGFRDESLSHPTQPSLAPAQAATVSQPTGMQIYQALEAYRTSQGNGATQQPATPQQGQIQPGSVDKVEVSLQFRSATLYQNGVPVKTYPVGIGRPDTPTPTGSFAIDDMEENPTYISPSGEEIPPGPNNPLGDRWARFTSRSEGDYGFHEGDLNSGSMGCIHLRSGDLHELYSAIRPGTRVEVY